MTPPTPQSKDSANTTAVQSSSDWTIGSSWITLGALIAVILLLSRIGMVTNQPAFAEMVVTDAGYTMMTTDGGSDEVLVLIDSRDESILVYRVGPSGGLDLLERESLSGIFTRAKTQALGSP